MKTLATQICVFWKKSLNLAYICEKCKLMGAFWDGERFNSVFWKNRVDGTQKFVQTWKLALKVVKPTIENLKNLENSTTLKILSIHSNNMRNGAKSIYNTHNLRFQQYFMHMKSSGTQNFNLNISHIVIFAENQRISILLFLKINFHFYFPKIYHLKVWNLGFLTHFQP